MDPTIRIANLEDAQALLDIYAYYIEETAITFEWTVPSLEDFRERIVKIETNYPFLVLEKDQKILGYCYAKRFKEREAYAWSAESSIYLKKEQRGLGLGTILYQALEAALQKKLIYKLYALVAYTDTVDKFLNKDSVIFHKKLGFKQVGHLNSCGFKFDHWYDLLIMEKTLSKITIDSNCTFLA